jgi:hypothetical protein
MVLSFPKNERYTMHSPDAIFIQKEPDKFKVVERRDKVNSEYIKDYISSHDDYYSDPITVYDKGVDPMRSFMYTNPAKRGFQTGSGKFTVDSNFRPPVQTQTDLLPVWKKRNMDYIFYDNLPEFKQFLQSISCNKDLEKILRPEVLKTDHEVNSSDPYKKSFVQVNNPFQVVKKNPIEILKTTSTQSKLRAQHSSQLDKELRQNINAQVSTNKSDSARIQPTQRTTDNFMFKNSANAQFEANASNPIRTQNAQRTTDNFLLKDSANAQFEANASNPMRTQNAQRTTDNFLLKESANAQYQTNQTNQIKLQGVERGVNRDMHQNIEAELSQNKMYNKNVLRHDSIDERHVKNVMSVDAENYTVHKQRDQVSYLDGIDKFEHQRGPETNVQLNQMSHRRDMVNSMQHYSPVSDRMENVQNEQIKYSNFRQSILPQDVNMKDTLYTEQSNSVSGYRPQFMNIQSNASVHFKEK